MGEPTYRLLTGDDLWLPGDALPGLLDGWCGPVSMHGGTGWYDASIIDDNGGGDPRVVGYYHGSGGYSVSEYERAAGLRLDCRRPEIRDHARRVLLAAGHDIGPTIEAELRGDITPTEAAGLVWCSLLRVAVGLGVIGPPLTVELDEDDLSELLADGWTLRSDGALLLPLPGGVVGRLEVSDAD